MEYNATELSSLTSVTWDTENFTTDSYPVSSQEPSLDKLYAMEIQRYVFPLLVIFGTVGHVLTLMVLIRPKMRSTSIYFYLLVLCGFDTVVLWLSCFKTWIRIIADYELLYASNAVCKTVTFFYLFSTYLSSWLIIAMTIDRFIAVWFPLRVATLCTIRHAWLSSGMLILLSAGSNLHVFWTYSLTTTDDRAYCTYDHETFFMGQVFEYLKLASYCFVPFIIVLLINMAIIYKLQWGSSFLQRSGTRESRSSDASHNKIIYLLLTVSFTWFFLTLPVSLLGFVPFLHNTNVARTVCFVLMYTNHSINFYLYCLTGRKFRQELKELFTCGKISRKQQQRHNGNETSKSTVKTDLHEKLPLTTIGNNYYSGADECYC